MSEAALWLTCGTAAAIAFMLTCLRQWRIVPAIVAGAAATLFAYLIAALMRGAIFDDPFIADLAITASLSVIFAGAGAAAGLALKRGS